MKSPTHKKQKGGTAVEELPLNVGVGVGGVGNAGVGG